MGIVDRVRALLDGDAVLCKVSGKYRPLTPEEKVRQWMARELNRSLGHRVEDMETELEVQLGSNKPRIDIAVGMPGQGKPDQFTAVFLVECKRADIGEREFGGAITQLHSYLKMCSNAKYGTVTNGHRTVTWRRSGERWVVVQGLPSAQDLRADHSRRKLLAMAAIVGAALVIGLAVVGAFSMMGR